MATKQIRNGRLLIFVLAGIGGLVTGAYALSWRLNATTATDLGLHERQFGHIGMEERMRNLELTVTSMSGIVAENHDLLIELAARDRGSP